jgi:hypothetical protein
VHVGKHIHMNKRISLLYLLREHPNKHKGLTGGRMVQGREDVLH